MNIKSEALNLLTVLANSVGAEYEDQDLALSIVETTMQKLLKECVSESLLARYIEHVGECEGIDYIDAIGKCLSDVKFSDEEIKTLERLRY